MSDQVTFDAETVSVAVHEAGHAVMATLTGFAVRYATVAPRDGGGAVVLRPRRTGFPPQEAIAVTCAGMIAEDLAETGERWEIVETSDQGDVRIIRDAARTWQACSGEVDVLDLVGTAWAMAFDVIVGNFRSVLAVAEQLLHSNKAMTGPQIRSAVNAAGTVLPGRVPEDGRTFWVPQYSALRSWAPVGRKRRSSCR